MKVIKKDGRIQSFDISKVRSSILGASIDSNTIINESDLKIVSNRVVKVLNSIREEKGLEKLQSNVTSFDEFKQNEYDKLADLLRENLDIQKIYEIMTERFRICTG